MLRKKRPSVAITGNSVKGSTSPHTPQSRRRQSYSISNQSSPLNGSNSPSPQTVYFKENQSLVIPTSSSSPSTSLPLVASFSSPSQHSSTTTTYPVTTSISSASARELRNMRKSSLDSGLDMLEREMETEQLIKQTFELFDVDGDGILSVRELKLLLRRFDVDTDEEELQSLVAELGSQTDGINLKDYEQFMRKPLSRQWSKRSNKVHAEPSPQENRRRSFPTEELLSSSPQRKKQSWLAKMNESWRGSKQPLPMSPTSPGRQLNSPISPNSKKRSSWLSKLLWKKPSMKQGETNRHQKTSSMDGDERYYEPIQAYRCDEEDEGEERHRRPQFPVLSHNGSSYHSSNGDHSYSGMLFSQRYNINTGSSTSDETNVHTMELMQVFKVFDVNNDGLVSVNEVKSVIKKLGLSQIMSDSEVVDLFRSVDTDRDNCIDFNQFCRLVDQKS